MGAQEGEGTVHVPAGGAGALVQPLPASRSPEPPAGAAGRGGAGENDGRRKTQPSGARAKVAPRWAGCDAAAAQKGPGGGDRTGGETAWMIDQVGAGTPHTAARHQGRRRVEPKNRNHGGPGGRARGASPATNNGISYDSAPRTRGVARKTAAAASRARTGGRGVGAPPPRSGQ